MDNDILPETELIRERLAKAMADVKLLKKLLKLATQSKADSKDIVEGRKLLGLPD